MSELTAFQERLAQLEKQVHQGRRMVAVSAILGALAIVGLLYQGFKLTESKGSDPVMLQAESFTLADPLGKVYGQWAITGKDRPLYSDLRFCLRKSRTPSARCSSFIRALKANLFLEQFR